MSINFPKVEEEVLAFWKEVDAFQTQLRLTESGKRYNFYDGPPFATGKKSSIRPMPALYFPGLECPSYRVLGSHCNYYKENLSSVQDTSYIGTGSHI